MLMANQTSAPVIIYPYTLWEGTAWVEDGNTLPLADVSQNYQPNNIVKFTSVDYGEFTGQNGFASVLAYGGVEGQPFHEACVMYHVSNKTIYFDSIWFNEGGNYPAVDYTGSLVFGVTKIEVIS
jgi:hypothetical protein